MIVPADERRLSLPYPVAKITNPVSKEAEGEAREDDPRRPASEIFNELTHTTSRTARA